MEALDEALAEAEAAGVDVEVDRRRDPQPERTAAYEAMRKEGTLSAVCSRILEMEMALAKEHLPYEQVPLDVLPIVAASVDQPKSGFVSLPCAYCGDEVPEGSRLIQSARRRWCSGECLRAWRSEQK